MRVRLSTGYQRCLLVLTQGKSLEIGAALEYHTLCSEQGRGQRRDGEQADASRERGEHQDPAYPTAVSILGKTLTESLPPWLRHVRNSMLHVDPVHAKPSQARERYGSFNIFRYHAQYLSEQNH
jgi:hypothetical protein